MRTYNDYCENRRIVASTSYAHTLAVIQVEQLNLQLENYNAAKAHHLRLHEIDPEIYTKESVESYDDQIKFQELVLKQKKADLELARHNYLKSERDCKTVYDEFQLSNKDGSERYKREEEAVKKAKEERLKKKEEEKVEGSRANIEAICREILANKGLEDANKMLVEKGLPTIQDQQQLVIDLMDAMDASGHRERLPKQPVPLTQENVVEQIKELVKPLQTKGKARKTRGTRVKKSE
jgi:hypothetical protein